MRRARMRNALSEPAWVRAVLGRGAQGAPARLPALSPQVLEISVGDPVKQGEGVNSYVSYLVSTKARARRSPRHVFVPIAFG